MKDTTPPLRARVKLAHGCTISKNYNSFRVDAGIELDCDLDKTGKAFERAKMLVEKQIELALDENKAVVGDLGKLMK